MNLVYIKGSEIFGIVSMHKYGNDDTVKKQKTIKRENIAGCALKKL